ncbi:zinc ribbon domain-containing protein [Butyrivibrio sp. AC2005]|uniref:zinc ribbon domain-containing protein n=1 Tax=Butyrivibrio sp. AC2005 TaxID=1280672 RepID=UPI0004031CE8|nr:zinc ribbon domain-containing protein [Butyrivibrio sp. AC2005]
MFCRKCGAKIPDNADFCSKCGEKVPDYWKNSNNHKDSNNNRTEKEGKSESIGIIIIMALVIIAAMLLLKHMGIEKVNNDLGKLYDNSVCTIDIDGFLSSSEIEI